MAGVETITNEILQDAENQTKDILSEAQGKADEIEAAARADAEKMTSDSAAKAEKDAASYAERIQSQIGMKRKQALLGARQDVIREVIDRAYAKLDSQDDASYFAMIEKLIEANAQPESGEILFSERDLKRLPSGFGEKASAIAEKKGGKLTLSREAAPVDNGFILRYGGIDENCSLKAIFSAKQEELQDEVHKALF
ncbi:MAG: V-type ATP synthase subunit E family protein [Eubacteriales bacterium]|jgi:V/A-type H+-transporting ATPase subunit E